MVGRLEVGEVATCSAPESQSVAIGVITIIVRSSDAGCVRHIVGMRLTEVRKNVVNNLQVASSRTSIERTSVVLCRSCIDTY